MQRTWTFRRIAYLLIPTIVLLLCVVVDQVSKIVFKNLYLENGTTSIIDGFFYLTYHVNKGAAWGFLSDKSWGITFFIILTSVALLGFIALFIYSMIKRRTWLTYSLSFIIGGTIGNFIDRVAFGGVTDFLGFIFWEYHFPIFNLADSFLVIGVIMVSIYFLFIDDNAVFKKTKSSEENAD